MSDSKNVQWNVTQLGSSATVLVPDKKGNLYQRKEWPERKWVRGILIEKGLPMPKKRTVTAEEQVAAVMDIGDSAVMDSEEQCETLKTAMKEIGRKGKEFQYFDKFDLEHWRVFRVE